jgi:energy-coupling factor transporter ATP-binding protein EcfA2
MNDTVLDVLVLLGPNGAGKTTTIEILEGFRMRSAGQVSVLGADPAHGDDRWRAGIGVVLQSWRDHGKWRGPARVPRVGVPARRREHHDPAHHPRSGRGRETRRPLGAWAVVGLVVAPIVLRRMARRESGSSVAARRQKAMQRVG